MSSRRQVRYNPLSTEDERDYNGTEGDPRFAYTPKSFDKVPWKSIALALFLLFLGSLLLFLSFFLFTGHMGGDRSQAYGLLMLGILAFLPGFDWAGDKETTHGNGRSYFLHPFHIPVSKQMKKFEVSILRISGLGMRQACGFLELISSGCHPSP